MILPKKYNEQEKSYGPDLSGIGENWKINAFSLNADGETYTAEVEWCGPCPYMITQLQGKLQLEKLGLYETVDAIVTKSIPSIRIYWQTATHWKRDSPILNSLAPRVGMDDEALDEFFTEADKLM